MRRVLLFALTLTLLLASLMPAAAASPGLTIVSPSEGAVIEGTSVRVEVAAQDFKIVPSTVPIADYGKRPEANRPGEGHVHIALDLWPLVVWEKNTPYTFTDVPPGEHQLKIEAVNNDHSSFAPPITQVVRFRTVAAGTTPGRMPNTGDGPAEISALAGLAALALIGAGALLRRQRA